MCEEIMERAKKMIDVDKIFAIKGNEGSEGVLNATKFCLSWRKINEFLMLVFEKKLSHERSLTGNIFGSVMAYIRRCKSFLEICFSNAQLYRSVLTLYLSIYPSNKNLVNIDRLIDILSFSQ